MLRRMQVALITGASQGLGLEIARLYAAQRMGLILTARNDERLQRVTQELSQFTNILSLAGDVANETHVNALVANGLKKFGHIDVLINNASELGPSPMPLLQNLPTPTFETILKVNLVA